MKLDLHTLQELLDYHYDRRQQVYDLLAQMSPEAFVQPRNVGWGSIRNMAVHCLECEEFWVGHRALKGPRPDWDFAQYPDVAAVRALAAAVRERTETFVATLTDADLAQEKSVTYSSGATHRFTLSKLFLHVITHDTHHRGQLLVLARQLGYEPQELDLL